MNNSLTFVSSMTVSKLHVTVTNPFSSKSQISCSIFSFKVLLIYTETDLVFPIFLINLKMVAFFK